MTLGMVILDLLHVIVGRQLSGLKVSKVRQHEIVVGISVAGAISSHSNRRKVHSFGMGGSRRLWVIRDVKFRNVVVAAVGNANFALHCTRYEVVARRSSQSSALQLVWKDKNLHVTN